MTGAQCRAARALLDISQTELAAIAKVGANLVRDFEHDKRLPRDTSIRRIRAALVVSGIEFIDDPDGGGAKFRGLPGSTPLVEPDLDGSESPDTDMSLEALPSPAQCRAARGFLKWSQAQAAKALHVGLSTLVDFENGITVPQPQSLEKIRLGFEERNITFSRDNGMLVTSYKPSKASPTEGRDSSAIRPPASAGRAARAPSPRIDRRLNSR